jgi:hypothetical protein
VARSNRPRAGDQTGKMIAMSTAAPLTDLIHRAREGDDAAFRAVFDAAYQDLRELARMRLSRGGRGTLLDTTSLAPEGRSAVAAMRRTSR